MQTENPFKTVALVARQDANGLLSEALLALAKCLIKRGFEVVFEADTARALKTCFSANQHYAQLTADEIGQHTDVAIVLGGDGTLLGIGRRLARYGTPLIGINGGRLGFITDIPISEMQRVVPEMLAGHCERDLRTLLEARIMRADQSIYQALAFNDVVVNRSGISGMTELRVSVNGAFMYNQRSDGLIVATPTGSTAYALAAQGPILHPQVAGIVLAPIAPHALSNRPIVLPDDARIAIQVIDGLDVNVNFDMQTFTALQLEDTIEVRRSSYTVPLLHPIGHSYYATLRKKLHWYED